MAAFFASFSSNVMSDSVTFVHCREMRFCKCVSVIFKMLTNKYIQPRNYKLIKNYNLYRMLLLTKLYQKLH